MARPERVRLGKTHIARQIQNYPSICAKNNEEPQEAEEEEEEGDRKGEPDSALFTTVADGQQESEPEKNARDQSPKKQRSRPDKRVNGGLWSWLSQFGKGCGGGSSDDSSSDDSDKEEEEEEAKEELCFGSRRNRKQRRPKQQQRRRRSEAADPSSDEEKEDQGSNGRAASDVEMERFLADVPVMTAQEGEGDDDQQEQEAAAEEEEGMEFTKEERPQRRRPQRSSGKAKDVPSDGRGRARESAGRAREEGHKEQHTRQPHSNRRGFVDGFAARELLSF